MGKASHTKFNCPRRDSRNAAGTKTTICRPNDTARLYIPLPNAWQTEEETIAIPANRNDVLIMRSAGTPILSMSAEPPNRKSNLSGTSWKIARPMIVITSAVIYANRTARSMRSLAGAVVERNNGHQTVVQAEDRHKIKL